MLLAMLLTPSASTQPAAPETHALLDLWSERPFLRFNGIPLEEGTSQVQVSAVLQDRNGFIWIGSDGGLRRYDGYSFVSYRHDPSDSTSLSADVVWSLYEDAGGTLWVGTNDGGLNRFDPLTDAFVRYTLHETDEAANTVTGMLEDRRGRFWVATNGGGLARLDRATGALTWYRFDPADPNSFCSDVLDQPYEDRAGTLWFKTANGLCRYDEERDAFDRYLHNSGTRDPRFLDYSGRPGVVVCHMLDDPFRPGVYWLLSWEGLQRYEPATDSLETLFPNPGRHIWGGLAYDPADPGVIWVATDGAGLYRVDTRTGASIQYTHDPERPGSLPSDHLTGLMVDDAGLLWAGTRTAGVVTVDPQGGAFVTYRPGPLNAPQNSVWSIAEDRTGHLWLGTRAGGIIRIDRGSGNVRAYRLGPADPNNITYRLLVDRHGTLWAGGSMGLFRYDPARDAFASFTPYPNHAPRDIYANIVKGLFEDHADTFWVVVERRPGTQLERRLFRFDRATGVFERAAYPPRQDEGAPAFVYPLYEDRAGRTWWRVEGGLAAVASSGAVRYYLHDLEDARTLGHPQVASVHERAEEPGVLWVATYGGGLARIDTGTDEVRRFTQRDGLSDDRTLDMLEDQAGRLWITTDNGLTRFDPEAGTFARFGVRDGLPNREFNQFAAFRSASGELYVGGPGGLAAFRPTRVRPNPVPPRVALTGFRLAGRPVAPGEEAPMQVPIGQAGEIRLRHDQDVFTFEFAALHFKDPARNRYAYRMEGFSDAWIDGEDRREATFTNLGPGTYAFRVKAASADGVWNEEGAAIRLVILPPWWRSWWAYALYGLFVVAGAVAADRLQRRRLLRRERARARLREAQLKAEAAEARAVALRQIDTMKSRLFANISHEFRTPLTLILGPVEEALADRYGTLPAELREGLTGTRRQARRLLRLVNQLLDLARLESGKMALRPQPGDFVPFLQDLVRSFSPLAERRGIVLQIRAEPPALPFPFDADALEKVFANLLSNALKFTPEGGKVWVTLRHTEAGGGSFAEVVVRDTGPGIAPEDARRIFDRFEQVDSSATRPYEGTGIGLALAKELVELHGGRILVESEPGFGSAFVVRLPVGPSETVLAHGENLPAQVERPAGPEAEEAATPGAAAAPAADAPTVLVVEDNAEVRALLRRYLGGAYRVIEATNGATGLEAARRHRPDLVLSDVMMPEMDGYALCRALKADAALRATPVVLLTARAADDDAVEGLTCGADDYVTKPFSRAVLKARLDSLLANRRHLRAQFSRELVVQPAGVVVPSEEEALLEQVLSVTEVHLGDPGFSVDDLATELGLSRRQLERRLKAASGQTPAELIRHLRLERAAQLLQAGTPTVAEVAYAVGYKSPSHFTAAFREYFGHVPTEHAGRAAEKGAA